MAKKILRSLEGLSNKDILKALNDPNVEIFFEGFLPGHILKSDNIEDIGDPNAKSTLIELKDEFI